MSELIENIDLDQYYDQLKRKIYLTKGVRFRAFDRLSRLNNLSSTASAFLSSYVIVLSVVNVFLININHPYTTIVPYLLIAVALIMLVFNLTDSKKEFKYNAELMHNCARDLLRLELRLKFISYVTYNNEKDKLGDLKEVSKKYADILDKHDGHSTVDFNIFNVNEIQRQKSMPTTSEHVKIILRKDQIILYQFRYNIAPYLKYWILLIIPLPIILYVIYPIVKELCGNK